MVFFFNITIWHEHNLRIMQPQENLDFVKGDSMTSRLTTRTRGKQLLEENAQEENLEDAGTPGPLPPPPQVFPISK